jgi:hypothetical protein
MPLVVALLKALHANGARFVVSTMTAFIGLRMLMSLTVGAAVTISPWFHIFPQTLDLPAILAFTCWASSSGEPCPDAALVRAKRKHQLECIVLDIGSRLSH